METWGSWVGAAEVLHIISMTGESGAVAAAAVLGVFVFVFFFDIAASEETRDVRSLLSLLRACTDP